MPSSEPPALLRTPLTAAHRRQGARLIDFAAGEMPVQYAGGILAEHQAVRTGCGVFDLSHMGRLDLRGRGAFALAQAACTRDLARLQPGEAAYTLMCRADGGIVDDLIAYVRGAEDVLLVCNASNRLSNIEWLVEQRARLGLDVALDDRTLATALIGVQGPRAAALLQPLCAGDLDALPGYAFTSAPLARGDDALVARTGYTGEDGFEVLVDAQSAEGLWTDLLAAGAVACGLGARDTLRTEAGFPLYGHEIDVTTTPFDARLGWVVDLSKPSFVGREALSAHTAAAGPRRTLVGLLVHPGSVPRPGFTILHADQPVGTVTSGTFSPTRKANIALGYVPLELSRPGQPLLVQMRRQPAPAEVVPLPFVPHRSRPRAKIRP